MEKNRVDYHQGINKFGLEKIKAELMRLDSDMVEADGIRLKPSQCYRFETSPPHILFNTNCPDALRQKVEDIISRHIYNE